MIRVIRENEIYFEDGYSRITVGVKEAFCNGEKVSSLEPQYANQIPEDHPAKPLAVQLSKNWEREYE